MSYCVNCGVELDKTAKKCALCGVIVINPLQTRDTVSPEPYPSPTEKLSTVERHYVVQILSVVLLLQGAISVVLNILYFNKSYWSAYAVGAFFLVFTMAALPLLLEKTFLFYITMDEIVLLGYLYLVELVSGTSKWFLSIAIPITLYTFLASAIIYIFIIKIKPSKLQITAAVSFAIGLLSLCVDVSINIYINREVSCSWSLIALPCFAALSLALYATNRHKRIRNELKKRFHI